MTSDQPTDRRALTPDALDRILVPQRRRPLWGLNAIAHYLGVSRDKAQALAANPSVPITKPEGSGMFFAFGEDLDEWLRGKGG